MLRSDIVDLLVECREAIRKITYRTLSLFTAPKDGTIPHIRRRRPVKIVSFYLSVLCIGCGKCFSDKVGFSVKLHVKTIYVCLLIVAFQLAAPAQKIRVGYDKSADFVRFKSYSWGQPEMPVTRPILYATIIGSVDAQLKAKGLERVERDGDLVLMPAGGMEFGLNVAASTPILPTYAGPPPTVDATMWTGAGGPSNLMAPYVPEGTLVLTLVDRAANKVVWTGTVTEKLDIENKEKSLELAEKAVVKLLKQFPPKKK